MKELKNFQIAAKYLAAGAWKGGVEAPQFMLEAKYSVYQFCSITEVIWACFSDLFQDSILLSVSEISPGSPSEDLSSSTYKPFCNSLFLSEKLFGKSMNRKVL